MTNLTFAIEAARRGCEFVTTEEDRKTVNFYRGDECHFKCIVNKCDRYERFIIGATLAPSSPVLSGRRGRWERSRTTIIHSTT